MEHTQYSYDPGEEYVDTEIMYIVQPGILACRCNPRPPRRILALDDNLVGTRVGRREDLRINVANFECPVG